MPWKWLAGAAIYLVQTFVAGAALGLAFWGLFNATLARHLGYTMPLIEALAWPALVLLSLSVIVQGIRTPMRTPWETLADDLADRYRRWRGLPTIEEVEEP